MITHHPSDELLLAYANGSLDAVLALAVGAHVDLCPSCFDVMAGTQALAGNLLETLSPIEMECDALSLLGRLDIPVQKASAAAQKNLDPLLPPSLSDIPRRSDRWIPPGIWVRPLLKDTRRGTRAYLLGARPNTTLPHHGHQGLELTQVLCGELTDGTQHYRAGDFLQADGAQDHRPMVGRDEPCTCLIASQGVPRGLVGLLLRALT